MKKKLFYLKLMFLTLWSVQMNAQDVLDQEQIANSEVTTYLNDRAQTFTAGLSGELTRISICMNSNPGGSGSIVIRKTLSNGYPDLTASGTLAIQNISLNHNNGFSSTFDVVFTTPTTVVAGTTYAIMFSGPFGYRLYHRHSANIDYPGGQAFQRNPSTGNYEVDSVAKDYYFKTYVKVPLEVNAALTNYTGCSGITDGSVTLTPTTGTAPYTYAWTSSVLGFTDPGNVSAISNLVPGTYTCVVTDSSTPVKSKTLNNIILDNGPIRDAYVLNNTTCGNYGLTLNPLATPLYQNSFTTSDGITLSGDAVRDASGQINLVPDQNNKNGKVIINNLPATLPADFEVNWRFFHIQKDGADGYSFNLGNDSFPGAFEDGTNQGLAVKFKIFGQDQVSIKWNGTEIVAPVNTTLELGRWIDAKLMVVAGKVTLYVNGKQIANEVTIPGFTQNNAYKIIFAARTGGSSNATVIDDVTLGDLSAFEYSIDGTTFQTSNVFSNITLPTDRTLPIWLQQNGCARKVRDYVYPSTDPLNISMQVPEPFPACDPTGIIYRGTGSFYGITIFFRGS